MANSKPQYPDRGFVDCVICKSVFHIILKPGTVIDEEFLKRCVCSYKCLVELEGREEEQDESE